MIDKAENTVFVKEKRVNSQVVNDHENPLCFSSYRLLSVEIEGRKRVNKRVLRELEGKVQDLKAQGFKPLGGPCLIKGSLLQAMVK